jgi:thiamine pyrophosphate-dependent acetolactate synthase large subunit-like protein
MSRNMKIQNFKKIRSIFVTLVLVFAINSAISYASSNRATSAISIPKDTPRPKATSAISIPKDTPRPKATSAISIPKDTPRP